MHQLMKLFIWIVVLAFSVIPGAIFSYFLEVPFGVIGARIGFVIGAICFVVYMSPLLSNSADIPKKKTRGFIFPFLIGLWLGDKYFDDDNDEDPLQ